MKDSAFIGVSLDSDKFSREWVRHALRYILAEHKDLEMVLADRLLEYNKISRFDVGPSIETKAAKLRIEKRKADIEAFLKSEIHQLSVADQQRVSIRTWDDFSDARFSNLLRCLRIAYTAIPAFRNCVHQDVEHHFSKQLASEGAKATSHVLSACYVLEETAMIIRITEFAPRPFDFYPERQIDTLAQLYQDRFRDFGLTVENMIQQRPTRVFTSLSLPNCAVSVGNASQ